MIEKITSNVEKGKLLHLVNRYEDIEGRTDVAPEDQLLQLATLRMDKGKTFKPHKHIWKPGEKEVIAQESWVVIKGKVEVFFYDLDDILITSYMLYPGDCSMTFEGGHTYEIIDDDTVVYEYKTGPYKGIENDKVFLNE